MDELAFRTSQLTERFHIQMMVATEHGKALLQEYSQHISNVLSRIWSRSQSIQDYMRGAWSYLQQILYETNDFCINKFVSWRYNFISFIGKDWTNRHICVLFISFAVGGVVGFGIGFILHKRQPIMRYMRAVQCLGYAGIESVLVVEDTIAPHKCRANQVLVNVKASSVQIIDAQICKGYGRKIRSLLCKYNPYYSKRELPVTLGRDCTGIVTDIGSNVKRLDVGDEVWLTVPFWEAGTLSQTVLAPEDRVSHKPKTVGYEAACSLPYAGTIALNVLKTAKLDSGNCKNKRILIQEGCTPVGCILMQILKLWNAHITTTCSRRAATVAKALGAHDVIHLSEIEDNNIIGRSVLSNEDKRTFREIYFKQLMTRDKFDVIFITKDQGIDIEEFRCVCEEDGGTFSTLPPILWSDSCGFILGSLLWTYVHMKWFLQKVSWGIIGGNTYEETHMCYVILDQLKELVENGRLQTVVDKVYHLDDVELALNHIQSSQSIGSTIITFRQ